MCWKIDIWAVLKSPVGWLFFARELYYPVTTLYMLGVYHKIGIPMTDSTIYGTLWYFFT